MAKAKKKKTEKIVNPAIKETKPKAIPMKETKEFTFKTRDGSSEVTMTTPVKGNKASQVLFEVLKKGKVPEGMKLQWADSYKAHFINRKGKNACGANSIPNLLVVNGIADELEAVGVTGIVQPTKKPYKAIKLNGYGPSELKELAGKIAMVLGFGAKKVESSKAEATPEGAKA